MGVAGLVAAATFAHSLDRLVATPGQYGVDFDLSMEVPVADIDARVADLSSHPDVAAVAFEWTGTVVVGGEPLDAVSIAPVKGAIDPVIRSGRSIRHPDEVVLGPQLAERLRVETGGSVTVGDERFRLVGTALDPRTVSASYADTAVLPEEVLRRHAEGQLTPLIIVRYAEGADWAATTSTLDRRYPWAVMDESYPGPPAELLSLWEVSVVPGLLQWFFGALIVAAMANGLLVAGRRHRHTLGVARGIGFTSGQVRATIASLAATMALCAVGIGVPIGLVLGTSVWSRVARGLEVEPVVAWPIVTLLLVVPVVVLIGATVAAQPARMATSRRPADVLRTE
jgi:hypothetical protein